MTQNTTTTAYLADGRHVDVPAQDAKAWAFEASELGTTIGLADWYTEQGDEHQDEIMGTIGDGPRCRHLQATGAPATLKRYQVVNEPQSVEYKPNETIASAIVCNARSCILDGLAWVERTTGERAVWIDAKNVTHSLPTLGGFSSDPISEYPLDASAAEMLMGEDGFGTFTLQIDKNTFFDSIRNSRPDTEDETMILIHNEVLSFGAPIYDSSFDAVAIDGETITIEYTTNIDTTLEIIC